MLGKKAVVYVGSLLDLGTLFHVVLFSKNYHQSFF